MWAASRSIFVEIVTRRGTLRSLWHTEFQSRYATTAAGIVWAFIGPLSLIAIYTLVFSALIRTRVAGIPEGVGGFGFFVCSGMLVWLPLAQSLSTAPVSLLAHGATVKRFVLPPSLIPTTCVLNAMTDMVVMAVLFLLLIIGFRGIEWWRLPSLLPAVLLLLLLVQGLALASSALNLFGRDVSHALATLQTLWFFASPIAYPIDVLPDWLKWLQLANPLTGLLELFRWSLLTGPDPSPFLLLYSVVFCTLSYALGAFIFQETRRDFVDLL